MWTKEKEDLTNQKNSAIDRKVGLEASIDNYHVIITENEANSKVHDEE